MRSWVVWIAALLVVVTYAVAGSSKTGAPLGCTGIYVASNGTALFGNNEDYGDGDAYIWFSPARAEGGYGAVLYGFADRYPQGGMNERGLSFDHFGQPVQAVTGSSHLPTPPLKPRNGEWIYQMLERCESVDEALAYLGQYNLWFFDRFQLLLADRYGDAAVVEGDRVVRKTGDTLVLADFLLSQPYLGNYPCWRYDEASRILREASYVSVKTIRDALDVTHTSSTCYSNVHLPQTGDVLIYYMHDFDRALTFNVSEELANGAREFEFPELLEIATRRSPQDGVDLNGSRVDFSWYGTAVEYEIVLSVRSDLSNAIVYLAPGCVACESSRRISRTVSHLFSDTTYYWMLRAKGDEGFWTESSIYQFTTGASTG